MLEEPTMQTLTLAEFSRRADAFDEAVMARPDIDQFCSRSAWALSAHETLMPPREPWLHECDAGFIALALGEHAAGFRYGEPLEAMWCFASAFAGANAHALAQQFAALCRATQGRRWDVLLLTGLVEASPLFAALADALGARCRYRLRRGPETRRIAADLRGGLDGFLRARSGNLRKTLRRAAAAVHAAGITFADASTQDPATCSTLYRRILAVEQRSWKGVEGVAIDQAGMREFYAAMLPRLARVGALRVLFAELDGRDVGYLLGGVCGRTYRGLQCSFDAAYRRLSLGNVVQLEQIKRLCAAGFERYDLGSDVPYKRRWGDVAMTTTALIVGR